MAIYEIEHYLSPGEQKDLYIDWLKRLRDGQAKVAVARRVIRIEQGNFGDHKFCREGVWWCCCVAATRGRRTRTSLGRWILAGLATVNR